MLVRRKQVNPLVTAMPEAVPALGEALRRQPGVRPAVIDSVATAEDEADET